MDRLQAMQIFTRVAEAGSFVRAAETLSLPSSTVTSTIKNLEKYLQVRLLNRTTRRVSLTPEGVQYLAQCRDILSLIEHAESSLTDSVRRPQGRLRVDMPAGIAHFIVMPNLQDFYRRYPDIYLMTGVSDRQVDLVQEGVDCVIRTGELTNSTLVARPLGRFRWITCASPDYLREYGVPQSPDELSRHRAIHYFSGQTRRADELRFQQGSALRYVSVNGQTAVNETGLYIKMCLEGYGLAQLAENVIAEHLAQGTLVEIMADWQPPPVPVTLLYPHQRFLSPAVRAFADWIDELI
ncbi:MULTISPECIES: LysR family transcriptional regulator [Enterobacter cloacae complex]|uniref:LysR substrate-binding domain-containing protein n=1 Tax=Enterobacter cloacae complex TaxID=354276 RepID=UPI000735415F|nr:MULTISPECIES: LysR family transcriptional regulator [Enterobacter cloacae complex]KTH96584.1 transcriptional regulator [Enterobacter cloacae subsp. cloacae]KTI69266.1 transcriptional regulator [Enterobacter cloacae subsp. cloacae]KVI57646.1 transcriptional regulator [Enterobacter cloacae subsp. cloacae]MCM7449782.1 LysR family transcriptional regulator [Enterobacter cloacae]MCM7495873.1 LysR family transcriptional regulator [Enterobacter cloacae]